MAHFFKPSDIVTKTCTIANTTRGGSAFGVCEDGEQVFISPKIVDQVGVNIGDMVTAYCIDNHRPEVAGEERYAVRWRAMRVVVQERFEPAPVAAPAPVPAPKPVMTNEQLENAIMVLMDQDRAWTTAQAADNLKIDHMRVCNTMRGLHEAGDVAACELFAKGGQDRVSKLYYARDVDLLVELIDEVVLDD